MCDIIQTEQVMFRNTCIYAYTHLHVITLKKRGNKLEREKGEVCGKVWHEEREGGKICDCNIISKLKRKWKK